MEGVHLEDPVVWESCLKAGKVHNYCFGKGPRSLVEVEEEVVVADLVHPLVGRVAEEHLQG